MWKLPWKVFIGLFLIATAIGYLNSEWSNELRERAVSPLEFKLRKSLSRGREYSEKLKVLVFGDKAKREFGVQELIPIRQWADFISQVAARQPKAIIFDKMFTFSLGTQEDIEYFNSTLAGLKTKVIAAGTFNDSAISEGVFDSQMLTSWSVESPDSIPKGRLSRFIGPAPNLRKSFFRIGGVQLSNAAAVYPAWIDLESEKMLPHLSLSYFENAIVQNDHVTLDDTTLFLDRYGRIPINFIDRGLAYTRFLPINSIFRLGWISPVLTKINKNDVVLVLPSMYTGSTDFKNSPIGRISGGLYYASLINTVLLNNPIKPVFNGIFSNIILFIIIAYFVWLLSSKLSFTRSVLAITFLSIVIVVLGLVTFAYWNIQSDWHTYSFFAALWGSGLLTMRAAQEERNAQFAEVLLEGIVSKDVLKRIKHRP